MKASGSKLTFVITFSIVTLAGFLTGPSPTLADGPVDDWNGHLSSQESHESKRFTAPANAVAVEILAYWGWSGSPNQKQHNESHTVSANGHTVHCNDFGDEELDGRWLLCDSVKFAQTNDLTIDVDFTGDNSSNGSHLFRIEVRWDVTQPPVCNGVSLPKTEIKPQGETVQVTINADNADQYRIIRLSDGEALVTATSSSLSFFTLPNVGYQAQLRSGDGPWTTDGCRFQFATQFIPQDEPVCNGVSLNKRQLKPEGETVQVTINAESADQYRVIRVRDSEPVVTATSHSLSFFAKPNVEYQAQLRSGDGLWTTDGCQFRFAAQSTSTPHLPTCQGVTLNKSEIKPEGETVQVTITTESADQYRIIRLSDGEALATGTSNSLSFFALPDVDYQAQLQFSGGAWTTQGCRFKFTAQVLVASCSMTTSTITPHQIMVNALGARDNNQNPVPIDDWHAASNFALDKSTKLTSLNAFPITVDFPSDPGQYWVQFEVKVRAQDTWLGGEACFLQIEMEEPCPACGQYQDFIGAVPFGTYTPDLEAGKEYFDITRSIMYNVEYINGRQADIVYRFNGQEADDVTSSLFSNNGFAQLAPGSTRSAYTFSDGVTKLIAYRYGVEQARIFQTMAGPDTRWLHPLDQPFEHKYNFQIQAHGPANAGDLLIYNNEQRRINYTANGTATIALTFDQPGLVAIYNAVDWVSVDWLTYPITATTMLNYTFAEIGLYHYRLIDQNGHVVAGPTSSSALSFEAQPGFSYQAQLVYPQTSLFVGLYNDMKFYQPDYWLMPIDARLEHDFEFHLDYHRLPDPELGNDHIRGDVIVDGLTLSYGTTAVAQQFPYGRHDGARPGVNMVGIPTVSMIAYCQRPGYHEVVYWGGWENESYYLPERSWIFDDEMAEEWNDDQRGECIDTARRVNMELARQGLRTDHTFRHHGQRSQGYQMVQQNIWSPYNLVGMRPPHVGQIFKPGKRLPYYENPEDSLFWGWDLTTGTLADGIGAYQLQAHVATLGPAHYVDMTGLHPAAEVFVPAMPALPSGEATPAIIVPEQPAPATQPTATPAPATDPPQDNLEPTTPPETPPPPQPQPTPEPPLIIPSPDKQPQV
ncbi:MAG: hypothetical protein KDJ52_14370 [Anaerolineae bacterium]|nr:hypothetical protein [Anaerolineae bacterium]